MIINLTGGGGGGLNFKVVGGTSQPVNPKENTIWVNTDTEITSWAFSGTEPESPAEGMVWISTGMSSTVGFNALKKNCVQVYPSYAKQYVSGAWVDVTAKSYQNGEWASWWNGELYKNGIEYESFTGGWDWFDPAYTNQGNTFKNCSKSGNVLTIKTEADAYTGVAIGTINKIDFTGYSTLKFVISSVTTGIMLGVTAAKNNSTFNSSAAVKTVTAAGTHTLDVSTLNDLYYVWAGNYQTDSSKSRGGVISEIILEK